MPYGLALERNLGMVQKSIKLALHFYLSIKFFFWSKFAPTLVKFNGLVNLAQKFLKV